MLRLSTFIATLSFALAITSRAAAQQVAPNGAPPPCPPSQVCSPIPPGPAPVLTPQQVALEQARIEQETRAQYTPQAYQEAAQSTYQARRSAYEAALEAARPPDAPIVPPLFETGLAMRVGGVDKRKDYVHAGPELSLGYRLDRNFVIDLPVSLLETRDTFGRWLAVGVRPSLLATITNKDTLLYARFGPDIVIPVAATDPLPNAFVGASLGIGFGFIGARLGNGGYAAVVIGVDGSVRTGVGGPSSSLDGVRAGLDVSVGVRFGF